MFAYLRYFAVLSLLLVVAGAVALSYYFKEMKQGELLAGATSQAEATVRAYADTVAQALREAQRVPLRPMQRLAFAVPYELEGVVRREAATAGATLLAVKHGSLVEFELELAQDAAASFAALVDERSSGRHGPVQEERARREQHADDVTGGERRDPLGPGRLEVVDRARAELDREGDRPRLRELVAVQAEGEAGLAAGLEVAARLPGVERAPLEEDVCRLCDPGRLREDVVDEEVDVGIAAVVGELGRDRVRAEKRRHVS